jgi:hypothetical protein
VVISLLRSLGPIQTVGKDPLGSRYRRRSRPLTYISLLD